MRAIGWAALWFLIHSMSVIVAQNGEISGQVSLKNTKGKVETLEASEVVVYIADLEGSIPQAQIEKSYVISTKNKQFSPQLMVVPKGATVQFPNRDPIIHNVFSVSGKNRFDAGRYSKGEGKTHTFQNSGLVRVYCNVHHAMNALLYVADNPYYAVIDAEGGYVLENVPPGEYLVVALHLRAGQKRTRVTVSPGQATTANIPLTLRKKRVKKHLNKFGKPYKRKRKRY